MRSDRCTGLARTRSDAEGQFPFDKCFKAAAVSTTGHAAALHRIRGYGTRTQEPQLLPKTQHSYSNFKQAIRQARAARLPPKHALRKACPSPYSVQ